MINVKIYNKITEDSVNIRKEVFVEEQGFKDEFDDIDNESIHIVLFYNEVPVGTARVYKKDEETYYAGRIAVLKEYRKKGLGRVIIENLEKAAKEAGGTKLELSAQLTAKEFYNAVGFKEFGEIHLDEGCKHISMCKNI